VWPGSCWGGVCGGDDRARAEGSGEPGDGAILRTEIELASGARLRISGAVDAATVSAVIAALTGRRR